MYKKSRAMSHSTYALIRTLIVDAARFLLISLQSKAFAKGGVEVLVEEGCRKNLILLAHDSVDELVLVEHAIAILVSPVHHLLKLIIGHVLAELLAHTLQVLEGHGTGLVVIEQLEDLEEVLTGVLALLASGHHSKELVEVDGAVAVGVNVVDELADLLGLGVHAERLHGNLELVDIDGAGAISVEEVESLLDLLDLVLGESVLGHGCCVPC